MSQILELTPPSEACNLSSLKTVQDFQLAANNSETLQSIEDCVLVWIKQIEQVTLKFVCRVIIFMSGIVCSFHEISPFCILNFQNFDSCFSTGSGRIWADETWSRQYRSTRGNRLLEEASHEIQLPPRSDWKSTGQSRNSRPACCQVENTLGEYLLVMSFYFNCLDIK